MKYLNNYLVFESVAQAKSILRSLDKAESDKTYNDIRLLLKGHDGYVGWFTKLAYMKGYSYRNLVELYDYINQNRAYLSSLGNLTTYDSIESLQDDVEKVKLKSATHRMSSEFPAKQRAFLKESDNTLLQRLSTRKDVKAFFKKVASYHNRTTMIAGLKNFLATDPTASMDVVIKKAKDNGSDIIHASYDDQLLIVRVYTVGELTSIAGDCSWCIKNSGTFHSYVSKENKQYVMFFFDKTDNDSRIGVTWTIDRANFYLTAHNKVDSRVEYEKLVKILAEYNFDIHKLDYKLSDIDINRTSVKHLIQSFKLSKEEIVKIKELYKPDDITPFTTEEIEKWNLLDKSVLNYAIVSKYSLEEIISKKLLNRMEEITIENIVDLYSLVGMGIIDYIRQNQDIFKLLSKDAERKTISSKDFYKKYIKDNVESDTNFNLSVGSTWSDNNYYNSDFTIFRYLWNYKIIKDKYKKLPDTVEKSYEMSKEKALQQITSALHYCHSTEIRYLIEVLEIPTNLILDSRFGTNTDKSDIYRAIIGYYNDNNMDAGNLINDYYKHLLGCKISEYSLSTYKKLFSEEQYESLLDLKFRQELNKAINTQPYNRESTTQEARKFYDRYHQYIKDNKLSFYRDNLISLILIYTRVGELDELTNITLSSYSGQEVLGLLDKFITNTYNTNSGMTEPLSEQHKQDLYDWICKQDLSKLSVERYSIKGETVECDLELDGRCYYINSIALLDEMGFSDFMDWASKQKMNLRIDDGFSSTGKITDKSDKKMFATVRPALLNVSSSWGTGSLYKYLGQTNISHLRSVIDTMINTWNLSLTEVKYIFDRIEDENSKIKLINLMVRKGAAPSVIAKYKANIKKR